MFNKISVAPLFNYTDKYCRYFYSLFTNSIKLYTGMIHTSYFLMCFKKNSFIKNDLNNVSVAIQLAGNNVNDFKKCAKIINKLNFQEININLGCPSENANKGGFGVFLMLNVNKIISCFNSIQEVTDIPVTLKHRICFEKDLSYNFLLDFVGNIYFQTKCKLFIIHARNFYLNKSVKYNLNIPLVNYDFVYKLKKDLPYLNIVLNGGIKNIFEIDNHLKFVDGVMLGRGIYFNPLILFDIHDYMYNKCLFKKIAKNKRFLLKNKTLNKFCFLKQNLDIRIKYIFHNLFYYIKSEIKKNNKFNLNLILRHVVHIFKGSCLASIFRERLILSIKYFSKFKKFNDFENFIFFI